MIVDTIWLLVSFWNRDKGIPREWLQLNIPYSTFLLIGLMKYSPDLGTTETTIPMYAFPIFLGVSILRTVVDYATAWPVYFSERQT